MSVICKVGLRGGQLNEFSEINKNFAIHLCN